MAISQQTTDALKKKYATADALQSSAEFSKLTPEMQKTALWAYTPDIKTMDINKDVSSWKLDVSQATIEPVKKPNTKPTTVDTPPATTPVETIKKEPEIKSTEVNPYQDDSDERISNIKNNLKIYTEDMPNLFANNDEYKKFFNYSSRSDTQKKLLDTYYNQYKYNTLFNGKTANSIWDMVINGTVSQWDIQTLNTTNPELYTQVQEYVQKNDEYNNANNAISGTKTKMQTIAEAIGVELPEDVDLSAKYTELHNTPEIQEASTKANTLYSEIQEIDQQISDMESIVEKEYEWTGATKDKISLIAMDRQEALSRERTRKYIAYQAEAANYNTKVANADNAYNAYKDQINLNRQQRQDTLTNLGFYYESTPEGIKEVAAATAKAPEVQVKDFWTSKAPNWKQSFDGGKTWVSMQWVSSWGGGTGWWGTGWWGTGSWISKLVSWDASDLVSRLKRIALWFYTDPLWTRAQLASWLWNIWADYEYIKNNLMLKTYAQAKAAWVTFWATSDKEWNWLKNATSSIWRTAWDQYNIDEANRLIVTLWWTPQTQIVVENKTLWRIWEKYNIPAASTQVVNPQNLNTKQKDWLFKKVFSKFSNIFSRF